MENEKVFNWDAESFFRILTRANKLAQQHSFYYARVSGLQGFEEVLANAQKQKAFVCVQTEDDGFMTLNNSPHTRRVKTVFLAMRYPIDRLDLRSQCFSIMQEVFRQFMSVLLKEGVYQYSMVKARQLNSQVVEANAWHHRSDALSSVGTAIGIGGAIFLGQRWTVLDPIASLVVGAFIVKVAVDLLHRGIDDLMEHSLPEDVEEEILRIVGELKGVVDPHDLRTRKIGNHYAIELHILMDGDITLREAHNKASEVEDLLRARYGEHTHVAVHVEPKENM